MGEIRPKTRKGVGITWEPGPPVRWSRDCCIQSLTETITRMPTAAMASISGRSVLSIDLPSHTTVSRS